MIFSWFFFATFSMILFSFANIFRKLILKELDSYQSFFYTQFGVLILFLIYNLINGFEFTKDLNFWGLILLGAFFNFFGILNLVKSYENKLKVGQVIGITNFNVFILLFLTIIFPIATFEFKYLLPILLIFFSIFLIFDFKNKFNFKLKKEFRFPIYTAISWGIYYFIIFYQITNSGIGFVSLIFYVELLVFIFNLILLTYKKDFSIKKLKNTKTFSYILICSVILFLGDILILKSYTFGINPSYISSILSVQIFLSSFLAYLILKEKFNKKQIIGILINMVALLLFYLL
jgi:drug/metabolite transporter (DMT)-like permease